MNDASLMLDSASLRRSSTFGRLEEKTGYARMDASLTIRLTPTAKIHQASSTHYIPHHFVHLRIESHYTKATRPTCPAPHLP